MKLCSYITSYSELFNFFQLFWFGFWMSYEVSQSVSEHQLQFPSDSLPLGQKHYAYRYRRNAQHNGKTVQKTPALRVIRADVYVPFFFSVPIHPNPSD